MFRTSSLARAGQVASTVAAAFAFAACGGAPDGSGENGAASSALPVTQLDVQSRPLVPPLPSSTLAVPAGNELEFFYDAMGVQIYACQASGVGYAWVFQAPEATLFDRHGRIAGKHYAGPTWEANDGSKVVGSKVAAYTVDPASIPWLLLKAVSHEGTGRMSEVTYIQRLETAGGVAPSSGCDADHVGDVARVDYTATYYFSEASND